MNTVYPVLVKKSVVESFACPVPTNESEGELSTCSVPIYGLDFELSDGPLSSNVFEDPVSPIAINEPVIWPLSPVMIPETLTELLTLSVMSPETINASHVFHVNSVTAIETIYEPDFELSASNPVYELSFCPVSVSEPIDDFFCVPCLGPWDHECTACVVCLCSP